MGISNGIELILKSAVSATICWCVELSRSSQQILGWGDSLQRRSKVKRLNPHTASLLTFQNYHYIWNTQRLGVDPCIHFLEEIARKLTVHLRCPNILPSIPGHNVSGEKSLGRAPACFKTHELPSLLQGAMSEADTMGSFVIS
jgi:hypothetical protein